jgi:hypothetical protein
VYVESSPPANNGDVALLVSPTVNMHSEASCLRFWYNMNGGGLAYHRSARGNTDTRVENTVYIEKISENSIRR